MRRRTLGRLAEALLWAGALTYIVFAAGLVATADVQSWSDWAANWGLVAVVCALSLYGVHVASRFRIYRQIVEACERGKDDA